MAFEETTLSSIYDQLLFLSGQNSTSVPIEDAVRLFNYALNEYTYLALTSDGDWKFDDSANSAQPTVSYNVVAGTSTYTIATSTLMIEAVHYLNGDSWAKLEHISRLDEGNWPLETQNSTAGTPKYYDLDGNILKLYPTPSESVTSGLKLYISRAADHFPDTALANTIGIPLLHINFLVYHALYQLSTRLNDDSRAIYRDELFRLTREVKDYFSRRNDGAPKRLVGKVNVVE